MEWNTMQKHKKSKKWIGPSLFINSLVKAMKNSFNVSFVDVNDECME